MAGFKKIVCIGDSLTEGDYGIFGKKGIKNVNEKNYPYYLAKLLPDTEILNCGVCGITPSKYLEHYKKGKTDVSGADYVIIMLGTNGGLDDKEESQGDKDYDDIFEYALSAICYVSGLGIMTGKTDKTINPKDTATRAEAAAVTIRFVNLLTAK